MNVVGLFRITRHFSTSYGTMDNQAFHTLEYDQLLALVRRGAQTPVGRARVDALVPLDAIESLQQALAGVAECVLLRKRGVAWSFSELSDPAQALGRLRVAGTSLEPITLLELARLCEQVMAARASVLAERDACPILSALVAELPRELNSLTARIANKILPSGEIDDRASPELARIRHEITRLRSSITRSLESLMRRTEEAVPRMSWLQSATIRFVIQISRITRSYQGVAHGFHPRCDCLCRAVETIDAKRAAEPS